MKKASNRIDMVGNVYNSWQVISHAQTVGKIAYYNCTCLECNTSHIVDGRNIRSGSSKRCAKCGMRHTKIKTAKQPRGNKSTKEMAEHRLFGVKFKDGRKRGHSWNLTKELFLDLIYNNCKYCGDLPNTVHNPLKGMDYAPERIEEATLIYNGVDRVDSTRGYEPDNVVSCCEKCNRAKLDYSVEEFLTHIKKIAKHQGWIKE